MIHSRDEPHPPRAPDCDAAMHQRIGRHILTSEIHEHNKEDDCWVVIDGRVFDLTTYLKDHPGGSCPVMLKAGGDASREYREIHARDADEIKEYYCIGIAVDDQMPPVQVPASLRDAPRALDPRKWIDITLVHREEISHDTRRFRFELPGAQEGIRLGLPVGLHVLLGAYIGDQLIVRPYTPIGPVIADEDQGYVEFVIKIYFGNKSKAFPRGGLMTQHIESLKVGDTLKMKGPAGHVIYHGRGRIAINAKPMQIKRISMVAGGTGITPMYQLARAICKDPGDSTQLSLLYANRSTQDILLRHELDELARDYPQFQVWYTVDQRPDQGAWRYSVGHVVEHMLRAQLFPACRDALTLLCGPPAMVELALIPGLESLGYTPEDLFEF
jgi:nitrate reductase (NAD(P)H)